MIDAVAEVRSVTAKVKVAADAVEPVNDRPENVATPATAATLVVPDNVPLPAVTLTVLVALVTVLLFASAIRTTGCVDSAEPDAPATGDVDTNTFVAVPGLPVAVNVTGEPDSDPDVVVRVFAPAVVPSVHEVTAATPDAFVVADPPTTDPPPMATANVTDTLGTALPAASVTNTLGAVDTAAPAVAD